MIILALLLASCQSNRRILSDEAHHQRAMEAIDQLGEDMLSDIEVNLSISALEDALPGSYSIYREYVPLYDEYKDDYLEGVADIAKSALPAFYDDIYDEIEILSETAEDFLYDDTSLTLALRGRLRISLIESMSVALESYSAELESVFKPSEREFNSTRNAYQNLSDVGIDRILPVAGKVNPRIVATVSVDALFDSMAESERLLKNRIVDRSSDSLYSIFWEGR